MEYSSCGARALREHYDKLVSSIQEADLPQLGAGFFSCQVISRDTMEMVGNGATPRAVRASKLMLAVMAGLDVSPDKFERVLKVLRENHVYRDIVELITDTYSEGLEQNTSSTVSCSPLKGVDVSPTATSTAPASSSAIQRYSEHVKNRYLRSKHPTKPKWPSSPPCKKVIKLAIVEKQRHPSHLMRSESVDEHITEHKLTPITMEDLLQSKDGSASNTVVVQGVPGIAKSKPKKLNVGRRSMSSQLSGSVRAQDSTNKQDAQNNCATVLIPSKLASERARKRPHPISCEGPEAKRPSMSGKLEPKKLNIGRSSQLSGSGSPDTLTVEKLAHTYSISSDQLDCEIKEGDMITLARHFDNVEYYLSALGLTTAEQTDVKKIASTQLATYHSLLLWRKHDPSIATLRTLLKILLRLGKGEIASNICKDYHPKQK